MSIVDAIQKAKRLAQERQAIEQPAPRRRNPAPAAPAPVRSQSSDAALLREGTSPMPVLEPFTIQTLRPYDPAVCSSFHIAVPGAQPELLKSAAAPYRMLRTLMLQRARSESWRNVAITSPGPGEGKSTTAMNLALSVAREGNYEVFLVDLDMRSPRICQYLGLTPPANLVQYFRGEVTLDAVLFSIGIDRLVVAGNTIATDSSSELLGNGKLEEMLNNIRIRSPNPMVILDLPPVGVTDDALVVAPSVDATLLVASQGRTRRDSLSRAVSLLSERKLAGIILNRSTEGAGSDYYYGNYGN